MNIISRLVLSLLAISSFASFSHAQVNAQAEPKEWTVLVFLNADNNLDRFGWMNLAEMEKVGSSDKVNVIVEYDSYKNIPTRRLYVNRVENPIVGSPKATVLQELGETNMGDYRHFADFLTWGVKSFPAKHYAVIVWNHGAGWTGVSYDDNPRQGMTMPEVRMGLEAMNQAIAAQRGMRRSFVDQPLIDIVNFDACIMSAIEIGYEMKNQVQIMVGSQFNEPGEGENYTTMLTPLVAEPTMTPRKFSEVMVREYVTRYKDRSGINYLAFDLTKGAAYTKKFDAFTSEMMGYAPELKAQIKKMMTNQYGIDGFDLVSVLNRAAQVTQSPMLNQLIADYGYPDDLRNADPALRDQGIRIIRYSPGTVYYRGNARSQWQQVALQSLGGKRYGIQLPKMKGLQYAVKSDAKGLMDSGLRPEAISTMVRDGDNPIIFHNNFPETSPVIADALSQRTKGYHGLSLYSLSGMAIANIGMKENNPRYKELGQAMVSNYLKLLFAIEGAPSWTKFWSATQ